MSYDREALSNPFYAEDIINNLEHQLQVAQKRINDLEQRLEDTIIAKEETYLQLVELKQEVKEFYS
jgi:predicted  nucleic acid-binding Zn-ribbon protein